MRAIFRFVVGLVVAAVAGSAPAADRPNIVWIVVDDMSADFGCYGAAAVPTPHVDRLAAGGDAVHPRLRDGARLFPLPLGHDHGDVSDHDRGPLPPERGQVREDLIEQIDMPAISLAAAGLPIPVAMQGRDVYVGKGRPEVEANIATTRRWAAAGK